LKTYQVTVNGHSYRVKIGDLHATPIQVWVDDEPFAVMLEEEASASTPAPKIALAAASAAGNVNQLCAPMPGTILEIRVAAGQAVTKGQELAVLEAMKMKNSIRSPRDGAIAEVKVNAGQTVGHGDVLFVYQS